MRGWIHLSTRRNKRRAAPSSMTHLIISTATLSPFFLIRRLSCAATHEPLCNAQHSSSEGSRQHTIYDPHHLLQLRPVFFSLHSEHNAALTAFPYATVPTLCGDRRDTTQWSRFVHSVASKESKTQKHLSSYLPRGERPSSANTNLLF